MGKLNLKSTVSGAAKASARAAKTAVRKGTKHALNAGKKAMAIEMPSSLNWIFSFGFKVGIFLILKSFLILRYQFLNLQVSGLIMIAAQFLQALVLIACGAIMQNKSLYDEPHKLRKVAQFYGNALLLGLAVFIFREVFNWEFFREPKAVNWFADFFRGISKGASEIGLSLLFWDCDLWGAFCGVLYFVTMAYLNISFDYSDGLWAKVFDRVHFLRDSHHTSELAEDDYFEDAV